MIPYERKLRVSYLGLHVIARMSPDLNWEDAVKAHPEWFQRSSQDDPIHHGEDPRLFRTCMFSTYMTDYMTAIMREINSLYDVDGLFTSQYAGEHGDTLLGKCVRGVASTSPHA